MANAGPNTVSTHVLKSELVIHLTKRPSLLLTHPFLVLFLALASF